MWSVTLGGGLVVTALMVVVEIAASDSCERLVVTTEDGKISGVKQKATKGREFYTYSIPYAKPPLGDLRLRDPVAGEGWTGVRDGGLPPPLCSQFPLTFQKIYLGEEDCLYLTVSTPKAGQTEVGLPVMVYIHGGAHIARGSHDCPPTVILNHDVVYVAVQYRLGVLGFLSTEDSIIPGNFGLKDQTLALRWVQRNIRNFGGDPNKVTIVGNSSGATCVHCHVLSPHSKGLFTKAIIQSGTMFTNIVQDFSARKLAYYTGKFLGCPHIPGGRSDEASRVLLHCLQEVDITNITLSYIDHFELSFGLQFGPLIDGDFLPDEPAVLMSEARYNMVDIMAGMTSHECYGNVVELYIKENLKYDLLNNFRVHGPALLHLNEEPFPYQLASRIFHHYVGGVRLDIDDAENICRMISDSHYTFSHDMLSRLHSRNIWPRKSTFLYIFKHRGQLSLSDFPPSPVNTQSWVGHGDELFYLFTGNDTSWLTLEREEDLRMRDIMTTLWINFITTGNPTPDHSLGFVWEAASPDNLQHLSLTLKPNMEPYANQEMQTFWESLPTRYNMMLNPQKVVYLSEAQEAQVRTGEEGAMKQQHSEL